MNRVYFRVPPLSLKLCLDTCSCLFILQIFWQICIAPLIFLTLLFFRRNQYNSQQKGLCIAVVFSWDQASPLPYPPPQGSFGCRHLCWGLLASRCTGCRCCQTSYNGQGSLPQCRTLKPKISVVLRLKNSFVYIKFLLSLSPKLLHFIFPYLRFQGSP